MKIIKESSTVNRPLTHLALATWFEDKEGRLCLLLKEQGSKAYAAYVKEGTVISYDILEEVTPVTVTAVQYKVWQ
ncbi:hypothetical protein NVP1293O_74 [Vibrio phage 1.293.O._10N.261.52.E1]|nr:hypothetical protein NVP1293O_74 [Vibrio phage 1.293.O._10N.261.52.E1]